MDERYIYIIKCNEFYKIGIASNLGSRFSSIQSSTPYNLEIYFSKLHNSAEVMEGLLHDRYENKNVRGEWFILTDKDLSDIKEYLADHRGASKLTLEYAEKRGYKRK